MRLGGQSSIQSTKGELSRGTGLSTGPLMSPPTNAPVSNQPTTCTQYSLPPAPEPVQRTGNSQQGARAEHSHPQVQVPAQHAGNDWGAPQPMAVQPAYGCAASLQPVTYTAPDVPDTASTCTDAVHYDDSTSFYFTRTGLLHARPLFISVQSVETSILI
jgi:hypothetical protein